MARVSHAVHDFMKYFKNLKSSAADNNEFFNSAPLTSMEALNKA